jgi:3-isopropylmalate/(R)-2-methylmalate dehydratase small subunit
VSYGAEFDARFDMDPFTKHRLLNGLDDIGLTMQYADDIEAFEASRPSYKPSLA